MLTKAAGMLARKAAILLLCTLAIVTGTKAVAQNAAVSSPSASANLVTAKITAASNDLAAFQVVNKSSGAVFRVYYTPAAEKAAHSQIPYLNAMIHEVAQLAQADAGKVIWSAIVLTTDPNYSPPRLGGEIRWTIPVDATGKLTPEGERTLYQTLPHEQVHAVQKAYSHRLPRWFAEGQASWIGIKVSAIHKPEFAQSERESRAAALQANHPAKLATWGGTRVKPEAILRQVSAEDRKKMKEDPGYTPPGPFSFGPNDVITDNAEEGLRYAAALRVFDTLESRAGGDAMYRWFRSLWASNKALDNKAISALARDHLKQDLTADPDW